MLLGQGAIANGARGLVLLDGAEVQPDEVAGLERVWLLFDGADEAAVQAARAQWTRLTGWGMAAQYWSDDSGAGSRRSRRGCRLWPCERVDHSVANGLQDNELYQRENFVEGPRGEGCASHQRRRIISSPAIVTEKRPR